MRQTIGRSTAPHGPAASGASRARSGRPSHLFARLAFIHRSGRIDFHRHNNARKSKRSVICTTSNVQTMITAAQLCAAMSLAGINRRDLAKVPGFSPPTVQRTEANDWMIHGHVDAPMKLASTPDAVGIDLIGDGVVSQGDDLGARLKKARIAKAKLSVATQRHRRKAPQRER